VKNPFVSAVSPWHAAWQEASLRLQTAAAARGDFARIPDIGRAAMKRLPKSLAEAAMDSLYEAYWNYRLDWDIRRLLEDDGVANVGLSTLAAHVEEARLGGRSTVTVDRDLVTILLEKVAQLGLQTRNEADR
jgi:hypothetical protein